MDEINLEYLEKQLKNTGFGMEYNRELQEKMKSGNDNFSIKFKKEFGEDVVSGKLNYGKSTSENANNKDYYFLNSYDMVLQKKGAEETIQNNFRVFYGNTFSLREAYSLLDGRSVNKDFITVDKENRENNQVRNAWAYMDLKNTDERGNFLIRRVYNFKLEEALSKLPIKGWEYPNRRADIIDGLHKGNDQMVILNIGNKEVKHFIQAAPKYNSLNFYDENMKPVYLSFPKPKVAQEQDQKQEKQQKQQRSAKQTRGQKADSPKNGKNAAVKQKATFKARRSNRKVG